MHDTDDPFKDLEVEGIMGEMDEDNAFRNLECCLHTLKETQADATDSGDTTFLDVDSDVSVTASKITDKDILADVTYNDNEDEEEEKDVDEENSFVDEPPVCRTFTELRNAVELLESYNLFSENAEMLHTNYCHIYKKRNVIAGKF